LTPDLGIEPGPHWWEASALTTAPSLHPIKAVPTLIGTTHILNFAHSSQLDAK